MGTGDLDGREDVVVDIGGILASGRLRIPFVEFGARRGKPRVMDGVNSYLYLARQMVAVNEVRRNDAHKEEHNDREGERLPIWRDVCWLAVHVIGSA